MKKFIFMPLFIVFLCCKVNAQIDFNKIDIDKILGTVIKVDKGFDPKFFLGNAKIPSIGKLGEILGVKKNSEINRLFKTYKTGRTVYKVASYTGAAIAVYGAIRSLDNTALKQDYQAAVISGIASIGSGVLVKLLTKKASYKAVDIFNKTLSNTIKDIFKIGAASNTMGVGLYVQL